MMGHVQCGAACTNYSIAGPAASLEPWCMMRTSASQMRPFAYKHTGLVPDFAPSRPEGLSGPLMMGTNPPHGFVSPDCVIELVFGLSLLVIALRYRD